MRRRRIVIISDYVSGCLVFVGLVIPGCVHSLTTEEKAAFLKSHVSISENDGQIVLTSNGLPNHEYGPFPNKVSANAMK